jgi:two-component system response regulator HydG
MKRPPPDTPDTDADFIAAHLGRRKRLLVNRANQFQLSGFPTAENLAETIAFAPQDGFIWLCGQRMMLLQGSAFGAMRRELINALGAQKARDLLIRLGRQAGARDAAQVAEQWPEGDHAQLYSAGPRLHMLEGMVNVEAVRFEIDSSIGHFYSEFLWHNSLEADEHIAAFGLGSEAACWMGAGYASGYASSLLGRMIVFREIECRANGHASCRIIGKPVAQWDTPDPADEQASSEPCTAHSTPTATDPAPHANPPMVGHCSSFLAAQQRLHKVAPTEATVLLTGESGVGKELFARALHQASPRQHHPWVALNCATLPENLVEAELFGVERGAFTGADRSRLGRFERAHGGTLFLDEIATLSLSAQSKILRALQEGEIERVGGNTPLVVNVRVIAASNLDLLSEVAAGRFREDLFYRLNVFPIHLPPLRERREDIPLLMNHFLQRFCQRHGQHITGFTPRLLNALLTYPFPGNIRELQNLIERGVIAGNDGEPMDIVHIAPGKAEDLGAPVLLNTAGKLYKPTPTTAASPTSAPPPNEQHEAVQAQTLDGVEAALDNLRAFVSGQRKELGTNLEEVEQLLIRLALDKSDGNVTAAAQMLGMSRAQISYRIKSRQ